MGNRFSFAYGRSYLHREDAISIYTPELPLQGGTQMPEAPLAIASVLRDASPDAWGRRVVAYRMLGRGMDEDKLEEIDELAFMLQSGSNRFGALDFQVSPDRYVPREAAPAPLEHLVTARRARGTGSAHGAGSQSRPVARHLHRRRHAEGADPRREQAIHREIHVLLSAALQPC